uniref:DUF3352 domain-containing protein n=1 Tax=Paulinella longichromatophora TaxID=1708747 RepID=A0A2H4ZPA2_9EUKA|nr:hypothetical protein PLO_322 [Paulinella longichromatophora]
MKARAFLLAMLATALTLLSFGLGSWWVILQSNVLRLEGQPLRLPVAARFIPRTAFMSFHLLTTPDRLVHYSRAVALPRQRSEAEQIVSNIRDEVFLLADLDYSSELEDWIGTETSLALFAPAIGNEDRGWLLILNSGQLRTTRRFLQRFWEARRVPTSDLTIKNYRGIGLISGYGSLPGQKSKLFATALIDKTTLLIASSPNILKEALEVSEVDELNQAHDPHVLESINKLENGVALLIAQPEAVGSQLKLPEQPNVNNNLPKLVAALTPINHQSMINSLMINSFLYFHDEFPISLRMKGTNFLQNLGGDVKALALVNGPNLLNNPKLAQDYPWLIAFINILDDTIVDYGGPFLSSIIKTTAEPFLWADTSRGWLLGTGINDQNSIELRDSFKKQGLVETSLVVDDLPTNAWTRVKVNQKASKSNNRLVDDYDVEASLAGARQELDNSVWWGQNVQVLQERKVNPRGGLSILTQLESLDTDQSNYNIVLTAEPAQTTIAKWKPWAWLQRLSNQQLTSKVQGIAISVVSDQELSKSNNIVNIKTSILFD